MLIVSHHSDIKKFTLGDYMSADHKSLTRKSLSLLYDSILTV